MTAIILQRYGKMRKQPSHDMLKSIKRSHFINNLLNFAWKFNFLCKTVLKFKA